MNVLFFVSAIGWLQICYPGLSKLQNVGPCDLPMHKQSYPVNYLRYHMKVSVLSQKYFNRNPHAIWYSFRRLREMRRFWRSLSVWLSHCYHFSPSVFHLWDHYHSAGTHASLTVGIIMYCPNPPNVSIYLSVGMVCWYVNPSNPITSSCHVFLAFFVAPFWLACLTPHSPKTTTPTPPRHPRFRRQGGSGLCRTSRYETLALEMEREVVTTGWGWLRILFYWKMDAGWVVFWEKGSLVGICLEVLGCWLHVFLEETKRIPMQLMLAKHLNNTIIKCAVRKINVQNNVKCVLPSFSWTNVQPLEIRPVASITSILGLFVCIKCFRIPLLFSHLSLLSCHDFNIWAPQKFSVSGQQITGDGAMFIPESALSRLFQE